MVQRCISGVWNGRQSAHVGTYDISVRPDYSTKPRPSSTVKVIQGHPEVTDDGMSVTAAEGMQAVLCG